MSDLLLYKNYNFNTLAPEVLGLSYTNQTLKSILDYSTAVTFDANIEQTFQNIKNILPDTQAINPKLLTYGLFESNDKRIVLALNWLSDITMTEDTNFTIKVTGGEEEKQIVIAMLANLNIDYAFI